MCNLIWRMTIISKIVLSSGAQVDQMEKADTKLSQEILCADSYIGIKEIISRKLEIDASIELIEAGAYDEEMIEGISDKGIEKFNASVSEAENNTTPRSKQ